MRDLIRIHFSLISNVHPITSILDQFSTTQVLSHFIGKQTKTNQTLLVQLNFTFMSFRPRGPFVLSWYLLTFTGAPLFSWIVSPDSVGGKSQCSRSVLRKTLDLPACPSGLTSYSNRSSPFCFTTICICCS